MKYPLIEPQSAPLSILVTGASGFIGAHLTMALATEGHRVIAVGGKNPIPLSVAERAFATHSLDLAEQASISLLKSDHYDAVIHAAALANSTLCEAEPERARLSNVEATKNLLALAEELETPKFIFISTDLVFDGEVAPVGGFSEQSLPAPNSVYARTKLEAEQVVLRSPTLSTAVVRLALTYGEKIEHLQGVMGWLRDSLERQLPLSLFADEYRTPLYVGSLAPNLTALIHELPNRRDQDSTASHLYHLGGPERVSRVAFGNQLAEIFGYDKNLIHPRLRSEIPSSPPRPEDVSLNSTKLRLLSGIRPLTVAEGFSAMLAEEEQSKP